MDPRASIGVPSAVPSGFPAHAGMDPRPSLPTFVEQVPTASPHTRGWTRSRGAGSAVAIRGFPAHAGMDPATSPRPGHTRGWNVFGCRLQRRLPRTRGDGPVVFEPLLERRERSGFPAHAGMDPRVRHETAEFRRAGFPAHAGMDPCPTARLATVPASAGFPAHAGMDPADLPRMPSGESRKASPHTRGWTRHEARTALKLARLPRTRGDGPARRPNPA